MTITWNDKLSGIKNFKVELILFRSGDKIRNINGAYMVYILIGSILYSIEPSAA